MASQTPPVGSDADVEHIENDDHVDSEDGNPFPIGALGDLEDFERQVEGAGEKSEPFGPDAAMPKSPGFDETNGGVNKGAADNHPQAGIRDLGSGVEHHVSEAAFRIDVEMVEQAFGKVFHVSMDEYKQDAEENDKQAFEGFEAGYGAKTGVTGVLIDSANGLCQLSRQRTHEHMLAQMTASAGT